MGIVSSTFLSLAVQFAWNFQRFLDPRYRYVEPKTPPDVSSEILEVSTEGSTIENISKVVTTKPSPEGNSTHQENRNRRAAQLRYRRQRPSSFDAALIVRNGVSKNGNATVRVVSSTPSTLKRQQAPVWDDSSSCSSSSSDDSDMNSSKIDEIKREETTEKSNQDVPDGEIMNGEEFSMSAAEEAAFRMTVGRGHFSRSKKDKFLNHLRLEKRLNGLNREFFELACRAHSRSLHRHNSGDLRRIV